MTLPSVAGCLLLRLPFVERLLLLLLLLMLKSPPPPPPLSLETNGDEIDDDADDDEPADNVLFSQLFLYFIPGLSW